MKRKKQRVGTTKCARHENAGPRPWIAFLVSAVLILPTAILQAQQSANFRLEDGTTAAAGGAVSSQSYLLMGSVAQPAPVGTATSVGFTLSSGASVPAPVAAMLRYALSAGWNLKGSPGISEDTIGEIFTGALGAPIKVGDLYYFDAATNSYSISADGDSLEENQGFWVFSYWGGTGTEFTAGSSVATDWVGALSTGWNLYSPSVATAVPDDSRITAVWRWDPVAGIYVEFGVGDMMQVLEGYWVARAP